MSWVAHPLPAQTDGRILCPVQGSKHGTLDWCPWRAEFLYIGGDGGGKTGDPPQPFDGDNNFRNEVWALKSPNIEWELRQPYCTGKPGNRPHRPDWGAFVPDTKRRLMWFWSGPAYVPPGKGKAYCDVNEFAPWVPRADYAPGGVPALHQPILAYDPAANEWINPEIPLEQYVAGSRKAWGAVYDPKNDELIRICYRGDNSPPVVAMHLSLTSKRWSYHVVDKANGYSETLRRAGVGDSKYFLDPKTRKVWMIDPFAWEENPKERHRRSWLYSYHVDERKLRRECEIPQTAGMYDWAAGKLAISVTFCGDPDLRRGWWVVNAWNKSALGYGGTTDNDHTKYDWTDVWRVLEVDLDTGVWSDITPDKVVYPSGAPTDPRGYFFDKRRLAITSGAFGRTVGYDSDHKMLVVCAGFASRDMFTLRVNARRPAPGTKSQAVEGKRHTVAGTAIAPLVHRPNNSSNDEAKRMVTLAWNGAAFDYQSKRFYLTVPGGHLDWYANESFVIDLLANRSTRLHDMTPYPPEFAAGASETNPERPSDGIYLYKDGKPASRHTYWMPIWLPKQQRVLMATGSCWDKGGQVDRYCGWLDPMTGLWDHKSPWPYAYGGIAACYDYRRNVVYHGRGTQTLMMYDPATDSHASIPRLNHNYSAVSPYMCFAHDPTGDYIYCIHRDGWRVDGAVLVRIKVDLMQRQAWERVNPDGDTSAFKCKSPGWEYEPDLHAIVCWAFERPGTISILHLDDMKVEQRPVRPTIEVEHTANGVFGRFRRIEKGRYAVMTSPFHPVHEVRLS